MATLNGWAGVRSWLRSSDSDWFHDDAVLGCLPVYEAEELLLDFGIEATPAALRQLGRAIDESLVAGR